jgi:hypothetical protein
MDAKEEAKKPALCGAFAEPLTDSNRRPRLSWGVSLSPGKATNEALLRELSPTHETPRRGRVCRETSSDVAVRRAYQRCTRGVPACCAL